MSFVPTMPGRSKLPQLDRLIQRASTLVGDSGSIIFNRLGDSWRSVELWPQSGKAIVTEGRESAIVVALEAAINQRVDQICAEADRINTIVRGFDNAGK